MARKTAEQSAKDKLKLMASKRPKEAGVYARSLDEDSILYEVALVCSDGKKRSRRVRIPISASNFEFLNFVRAAKTEMEDEAKKAVQSQGNTLMDYLQEFATAKNLKPKTIEKYQYSLEGFSLDNASNDKKVKVLMASSSLKDGTKRTRLKCLRSFYTWLSGKLPAIKNPVDGQKMPKAGTRSRIPTKEELDLLLERVDATGSQSDRLFVRLLVYTGARCSTIQALRPCDLDTGLRLSLFNVKLSRKYAVKIPVNDPEILGLWSSVIEGMPRDEPIFSDKHHDRLKKRMIRLFGKDANGETISPHSLRHLKATKMALEKVPVKLASTILDVSPQVMLSVYTTVSQSDIDAVFR